MPSMTKTSSFLGLLTAAARVSAHGFVQNIVVDGSSYVDWLICEGSLLTSYSYTGYLITQYPYETDPPASIGWSETATDLGFVAPDAYGGGDIICHRGATNAQASATVKAGGTVVMEWNTWPVSHHGPVIDYVSYNFYDRRLDQSILLHHSIFR
jgi:cellulase